MGTGLTYKKGKTVKVKHKTSGKTLVVIDKPNVRKEYEKIGYFAEGTCGYGLDGEIGEQPAGPHLLKKKKDVSVNEADKKKIKIKGKWKHNKLPWMRGPKKKNEVNEITYQFKGYTNSKMDELDAMLSRAGVKGKPDFNNMTYSVDMKGSNSFTLDKIMKRKGGKKIKESVNEIFPRGAGRKISKAMQKTDPQGNIKKVKNVSVQYTDAEYQGETLHGFKYFKKGPWLYKKKNGEWFAVVITNKNNRYEIQLGNKPKNNMQATAAVEKIIKKNLNKFESVNEAKYKGYDYKRQNRKDGLPLIVPALRKTFANMKDLKKYIDKHGTMESVNEAFRPSDKKALMVIGRDIINNIKKKNKNLKPSKQLGQALNSIFRAMTRDESDANYKQYKKYFPKYNAKLLRRLTKAYFDEPVNVQNTFVRQVMDYSLKESINEAPGKSGKDQYVGNARVKVEPYTYKNQKRDFHDVSMYRDHKKPYHYYLSIRLAHSNKVDMVVDTGTHIQSKAGKWAQGFIKRRMDGTGKERFN